ncbi:hypothetical protein BMS3Bbin04_00647 [bacterium BMS3Bbin04]|nr:hypothetical protein BMS3Bbin04_00647 [bacterium BMS3Bbin04]
MSVEGEPGEANIRVNCLYNYNNELYIIGTMDRKVYAVLLSCLYAGELKQIKVNDGRVCFT